MTGSFEIEIGAGYGQDCARRRQAVLADIEKIKTDGVDEDRLRRAKAAMKIDHLKEMQTSQDVAATMATDYLSTGDVHFSDLYVAADCGGDGGAGEGCGAGNIWIKERLVTTALFPREAVGAGGLPKAEDLLRQQADNAAVGDGEGGGGFGES